MAPPVLAVLGTGTMGAGMVGSLRRAGASSRNGITQVPTLTSHSPSSRATGSVS